MTPILDLPGIGPHMASKLNAKGISTAEQFASTSPETLREIPGIGERSVETLLEAARGVIASASAEGTSGADEVVVPAKSKKAAKKAGKKKAGKAEASKKSKDKKKLKGEKKSSKKNSKEKEKSKKKKLARKSDKAVTGKLKSRKKGKKSKKK